MVGAATDRWTLISGNLPSSYGVAQASNSRLGVGSEAPLAAMLRCRLSEHGGIEPHPTGLHPWNAEQCRKWCARCTVAGYLDHLCSVRRPCRILLAVYSIREVERWRPRPIVVAPCASTCSHSSCLRVESGQNLDRTLDLRVNFGTGEAPADFEFDIYGLPPTGVSTPFDAISSDSPV